MTMDGRINADFITTGTLDAARITTGVLKSSNYKQNVSGTSINLLNGAIDTANFKVNAAGEITATAGQVGGFLLGTNEFSADITLPHTYTNADAERLRKIIMGEITATANDYEKYDFKQKGEFDSSDLFIIQNLILGKFAYNGLFKLNTSNARKALQILDGANKLRASVGMYGSYFWSLSATEFITDSCEAKGGISADNGKIGIGRGEFNNNASSYISLANESSIPTIYLYGRNGNITCATLTQTSLKTKKKNIKKLKINALDLIKNADICSYNLKTEKTENKKHIGLIIDEDGEYNCPDEVIAEDKQGIEQYSMISMAWKAIQELVKENSNLKQRIEKLEKEVGEISEKGRNNNS